MIGDVIGIGSRVRVNAKFATADTPDDAEAHDLMLRITGSEEGVEASRLAVIGKTGTVTCIHSHTAWPYTVLFDQLAPDGGKWVLPTTEDEIDVVDDLDERAAALISEESK